MYFASFCRDVKSITKTMPNYTFNEAVSPKLTKWRCIITRYLKTKTYLCEILTHIYNEKEKYTDNTPCICHYSAT